MKKIALLTLLLINLSLSFSLPRNQASPAIFSVTKTNNSILFRHTDSTLTAIPCQSVASIVSNADPSKIISVWVVQQGDYDKIMQFDYLVCGFSSKSDAVDSLTSWAICDTSSGGGVSSSLFPNGLSEETVSRELTSADIGKLLIIVNDSVILTPASDMVATGDLPKGFGIWCLNPTTKTSGFKVNPPSTNIYLESATAFNGATGIGEIVSFMTLYDDDLVTSNIYPITDIMLSNEFTGTVDQLAIPYLLENLGFRGTATLSSGTVTVATDKVLTGYKIYLSVNTPSGTQGFLSAPTGSIVDGTSFVINSTNAGDNSTVNWWIAP